MSFQLIPPPPSLRRYVRHLWVLEGQSASFTVLCSGQPGLIFQEDPTIFTGFEGERLPQAFVFGQATSAGRLHSTGPFRTIGVSLEPAALPSIIGLNAAELASANGALTDLVPTAPLDRLRNAGSVTERAACLFSFLEEQVHRHASLSPKVLFALSALEQGRPLAGVLRDVGVTERTLERLFLFHVGITPTLYARICRFQASLALLRSTRTLTDIAYATGYYDQSHFIRDFKQFAGVNPGHYRRQANEPMPGFPEW